MRGAALILLLALQIACALFFLWDILSALLGWGGAPIDWRLYELIQIGAALGLLIGVGMGALLLRRLLARNARVEAQLRVASGAFGELVEERFEEWGLTPAERDVALFSLKGLSTQEVARLREVSEGTVKAQTAAIYRKAGVSGRPQLLSLFIDDLMGDAFRPFEAEPGPVASTLEEPRRT